MTNPSATFSILVVCTANICRSPLAECLLRDALSAAVAPGLPHFEVRSAGTHGWDGSEMDVGALAELRRLGGDPGRFRARSLAVADCVGADLILTAATEHRAYVLQAVPAALRRTFTLLELAHLVSSVPSVDAARGSPTDLVSKAAEARGAATLDDYDLPDPYGAPRAVQAQVATAIFDAVRGIVPALTGRPPACAPMLEP